MPLSTLRSSERATPRGLFGNSGSMIDHSKSEPTAFFAEDITDDECVETGVL
jgi:hypothetical protein